MFNISDKRLWGNEAADDENPQILNSYFLIKNEYSEFICEEERLVFARGKKGTGKSALLNDLAFNLVHDHNKKSICINIKGSDLIAQKDIFYGTPNEHIHDWLQRICMIINREIGRSINFAINDDEMLLVESSELSGYKKRNLFGSLLARMKFKILNAELRVPSITDEQQILERMANSQEMSIWLLIDDIDATFINSDGERRRVSTFFSACREMLSYEGINIRATIRTDVWASIRKNDESLDKVEQYVIDLTWTKSDIGKLLAKRINSYENRVENITDTGFSLKEKMIEAGIVASSGNDLAFDKPKSTWEQELKKILLPYYYWGTGARKSYELLHLLGAGRPRWILQLCRMAATEAKRQGDVRIKFGYIKSSLKKYCSIRIDDISREFNHQCSNIPEIINIFANKSCDYSTEELLNLIEHRILSNTKVTIDGLAVVAPKYIAHFLYKIEFIHAQYITNTDQDSIYCYYEDNPDLLKYESSFDVGVQWHVHPAFRSALNISNNQKYRKKWGRTTLSR